MLAELQEYATEIPVPQESASVLQTVAYLKACNQMFERGILGKKVFIKSLNSPIILNMDQAFRFFAEWLNEHLAKGKCLMFMLTSRYL